MITDVDKVSIHYVKFIDKSLIKVDWEVGTEKNDEICCHSQGLLVLPR